LALKPGKRAGFGRFSPLVSLRRQAAMYSASSCLFFDCHSFFAGVEAKNLWRIEAHRQGMSQVSQLANPSVRTVEFAPLAGRGSIDDLSREMMPSLGIVYVTAITRDGCSGCIEQKPLFNELAAKITAQHSELVSFSRIHVQYSESDRSQSGEAKKILRHGAYPTYMIHVGSRYGPLELYRAIYPSMSELEKQVGEAFELAEFYKTDAQNKS
jgi:hypothetical protein